MARSAVQCPRPKINAALPLSEGSAAFFVWEPIEGC